MTNKIREGLDLIKKHIGDQREKAEDGIRMIEEALTASAPTEARQSALDELLPCPFCGGQASHNEGGNSVYGRLWWSVWCTQCNVAIHDREVWQGGTGLLHPNYPAKECFERWNTRAPDTVSVTRVELEVLLKKHENALRGIYKFGGHNNPTASLKYQGEARDVIDRLRDIALSIIDRKGGV